MRIANRETVGVCPKCNGTLLLNHELMIWKCTATRCHWHAPAYTAPKQEPDPLLCPTCKRVLQNWDFLEDDYPYFCDLCTQSYNAALEKEPAAPKAEPDKPLECPYCKVAMEYDPDVRDDYRYHCGYCRGWYNASAKPQPGQHITIQVPFTNERPAIHCFQQFEAVAAAAVGLYIRSAGELHYIPTERTQNALAEALQALITAGWRPK